ncbi:MAG: DUF58 domain-containing protein [Thermomicrobiales bacterium]|nr:DUF58 domain-containing protein [Thermomicrobiales bacterium]MCO5223439.1 DUF58 domain-containing protein [Thermomicrobiales bacterium]
MTYRSFVTALLAAGLFGAGEGFDWPVLRQLGAAVAVVFALAYLWSRLNIARLSARRTIDGTSVQVGAVFADQIAVRSKALLPKLWIELRDRSELPAHDASRVFGMGSRATVSWETRSIAVKRGVFAMGPVFLRAGDPFAIFSHERRVDFDSIVTVLPPVFDLSRFELPGAQSSGGRQIDRRTPFTTAAVSSVRDYASGDPFNRIAWSTSARTGKLMVKEFDLDPTAEIWVIADFGLEQAVRPSRDNELQRDVELAFAEAWLDSSEDYVAALAASVSRKAVDANRALGYLTNSSSREYRPAESSERQYLRVLNSLAVARSDGRDGIETILDQEMRRFDRYRSPVVITASTETDWLDSLEYAYARGVRPTVIYVDPETFDSSRSSKAVRAQLAAAPFPVHIVDYRTGIDAGFSWDAAPTGPRTYFNVN